MSYLINPNRIILKTNIDTFLQRNLNDDERSHSHLLLTTCLALKSPSSINKKLKERRREARRMENLPPQKNGGGWEGRVDRSTVFAVSFLFINCFFTVLFFLFLRLLFMKINVLICFCFCFYSLFSSSFYFYFYYYSCSQSNQLASPLLPSSFFFSFFFSFFSLFLPLSFSCLVPISSSSPYLLALSPLPRQINKYKQTYFVIMTINMNYYYYMWCILPYCIVLNVFEMFLLIDNKKEKEEKKTRKRREGVFSWMVWVEVRIQRKRSQKGSKMIFQNLGFWDVGNFWNKKKIESTEINEKCMHVFHQVKYQYHQYQFDHMSH